MAKSITYPDEAVMEEEPYKARAIAGVLADGGVDDGLDEVLGARAGVVVVSDLEPRGPRLGQYMSGGQEEDEEAYCDRF